MVDSFVEEGSYYHALLQYCTECSTLLSGYTSPSVVTSLYDTVYMDCKRVPYLIVPERERGTW
jgi:hypothetical protein